MIRKLKLNCNRKKNLTITTPTQTSIYPTAGGNNNFLSYAYKEGARSSDSRVGKRMYKGNTENFVNCPPNTKCVYECNNCIMSVKNLKSGKKVCEVCSNDRIGCAMCYKPLNAISFSLNNKLCMTCE